MSFRSDWLPAASSADPEGAYFLFWMRKLSFKVTFLLISKPVAIGSCLGLYSITRY
jgi:hypothetical protein